MEEQGDRYENTPQANQTLIAEESCQRLKASDGWFHYILKPIDGLSTYGFGLSHLWLERWAIHSPPIYGFTTSSLFPLASSLYQVS